MLDEGHADLISLGRAALAGPDYPVILAKGAEPATFTPAMLMPTVTLANAAGRRERHHQR